MKVAQSVYDWFHSERNVKFWKNWKKRGLKFNIKPQILNLKIK